LDSQEQDNIFNHTYTYTADGRVTFGFTDEVLPEHIKQDCIDGFKKVYPVEEKKK